MQCGGKWLSQGMIDLNSAMVAPEATQPPLIVMDARMSPITFLRVEKTLFLEDSGNINIEHLLIISLILNGDGFLNRQQS